MSPDPEVKEDKRRRTEEYERKRNSEDALLSVRAKDWASLDGLLVTDGMKMKQVVNIF